MQPLRTCCFSQCSNSIQPGMPPAGLRLLGFKPCSMLKHYHQLRSPTFVYPDERSMPGSTQTFIAFHATMLAKDRMAICSFVRTKASEPRLVALLPQVEEVDDFGAQVQVLPLPCFVLRASFSSLTFLGPLFLSVLVLLLTSSMHPGIVLSSQCLGMSCKPPPVCHDQQCGMGDGKAPGIIIGNPVRPRPET